MRWNAYSMPKDIYSFSYVPGIQAFNDSKVGSAFPMFPVQTSTLRASSEPWSSTWDPIAIEWNEVILVWRFDFNRLAIDLLRFIISRFSLLAVINLGKTKAPALKTVPVFHQLNVYNDEIIKEASQTQTSITLYSRLLTPKDTNSEQSNFSRFTHIDTWENDCKHHRRKEDVIHGKEQRFCVCETCVDMPCKKC